MRRRGGQHRQSGLTLSKGPAGGKGKISVRKSLRWLLGAIFKGVSRGGPIDMQSEKRIQLVRGVYVDIRRGDGQAADRPAVCSVFCGVCVRSQGQVTTRAE